MEDAVRQMPVSDFLAWRFAVATVVVAAVRPRSVLRLGLRGVGVGVIAGSALGSGYALQTAGLLTTSATVSGFLTGTFVVITPLAGALLLRERLSGPCRAGVFLASVGLVLLSLREFAVGVGEALTLACAVAFALHVVALGAWSSRYDAHGLVVVQLLTVTVAAGVVAVPQGVVVPGTRSAWTTVLVTAVAATAVGYFLQTWAQARLSATRTAVILTGEPVFAGLAGVLVVGDRLDGRAVAGCLLVLVAMSVVAQEPYEGRHRHPHRQGRSVVPRASIPAPRREATPLARPSGGAPAAVPRQVGRPPARPGSWAGPADDGTRDRLHLRKSGRVPHGRECAEPFGRCRGAGPPRGGPARDCS